MDRNGEKYRTRALVDRVTEACAARWPNYLSAPFWSRLSTTPSRYRLRRLPLRDRFSFLLPPRVRVKLPRYLGQTGPRVCSMMMMTILRLQFFKTTLLHIQSRPSS